MVVAQKLKEAEITEQDSLLLTRNLLRIAIFNISYIRGLFPEKYFNDKQVPALEMKIKKLMPMDAESRRLIDWMEKGVYDALQKKYLQKLLFCICETVEGPMIEEYTFSFTYSNSDSPEVLMNINRPGNKKQGATFKSGTTTDVTPNQMRSSACKMVRTLVQLMRTLDRMPEERTILMKLLYYDDVTPIDYEPPFFRCCAEPEANNAWTKNPLKLEVGSVNSRHLVLALKVKSVLDPCEDENGDTQDDEAASLGGSSMHEDNSSGSDSEVDHSQGEYIVAPAGKGPSEDNGIVDEEDTQDTVMDDQQLAQVRDWISSRHIETVELTDVLSNFPDISVMLTEDIMDKLIKEGVLSKAGKDIYSISNRKNFDSPLSAVKEEAEAQVLPPNGKADKRTDEDYLYMKALYHALPMDYVTIAKLQAKLEGEANQAAVRKLIDKMTHDGFLDGKGRRFGKRVIHSELTTNKLLEVKKALETKALEAKTAAMEICEYQNKSDGDDFVTIGNRKEMSTCGGFHSIGSDLTRTGGKAGTFQNDSVRSEHTTGKMWGQRNSPLSRAEMGPVASRESAVPRKQIDGQEENGRTSHSEEGDKAICSRSSQDKRSRKASTVKEPILQYVKRQKAQVA